MKTVKFRDYLVEPILNGSKTSTWRLFDDKNLSLDDHIELRVFGSDESFAEAVIINVAEKAFKDLTEEDKRGHERYKNDEEMYKIFSGYYQKPVGPETKVKIIHFRLLSPETAPAVSS